MAAKSIPTIQFEHFYTYTDMMQFLQDLESARPGLCRLSSLGTSREGRDVPLLTITDFKSADPEDSPGYLLYGSIHAHELAATHAPLYVARELLSDEPDIIKRLTFYLIPRLTVDSSEFTSSTSARIRSRTVWDNREPNSVYQEDIDGNGLILTMRQEHPDGQWIADPQDPRLLIRRKVDSPGPYYRTFPEGRIHDWDGSDRIKPGGLHAWLGNEGSGGRSFDWNRNFSWNWKPENEEQGAGDFPFSEIEMRHLAEFMHQRENLFGVTSFHCGYSSILRPPSAGKREDLDEEDDRMMQEIAEIGSEETGFPSLSPADMHWVTQRTKPKAGHFLSFCYQHLGLFGFEIELGTVMDAAGMTTEDFLSTEKEEQENERIRRLMKWWDSERERQPLFVPWTPFEHPQLGLVEIGGFLYSFLDNPALFALPKTLEGVYRFILRHAQMHPEIRLEDMRVDSVGGNVYRIRARVANRGRFPTHISNRGRSVARILPVHVEFHPAQGVELLSYLGHMELGHLAGITGSFELEWFVTASSKSRRLCELRVFGGTGGNKRKTFTKPEKTG